MSYSVSEGPIKTVAATVHLREPPDGSCILNNLSNRGKGIAGKLNLSKEGQDKSWCVRNFVFSGLSLMQRKGRGGRTSFFFFLSLACKKKMERVRS